MLMNNKFHQTKLKNNATKLNLVQALQTNTRLRTANFVR